MLFGCSRRSLRECLRRSLKGLCFYCRVSGYQVSSCSLKNKPVGLKSHGFRSAATSHGLRLPQINALLQANGKEVVIKPFTDSGADTEFIDYEFAFSLGISNATHHQDL